MMVVASTLAGFFSYIYQVYMGRALGPEDYGIFGALFAIFYMIGIIAQTLGTTSTRFVSKYFGEGKQIGFFLAGSMKQMALLGLAVSLIFIAGSGEIVSLLKLPGDRPVIILAPILFLSWVSPIGSGALRGVKRFKELGFVSISNAFFKLLFGFLLVSLGFGVSGALLGLAAGILFALCISLIFLRPYFRQNGADDPEFNFSSFYSYSLPVLLAMVCYSIPANLDVVFAKYFFSATEAGLYTSASVLGKIIFFFPAGVYAVMFPMISERHARGENTSGMLKKSLLYTGILSGSVALAYIIYPEVAVMVFGSNFKAAVPLVAPYGLAMFFFSLTSILMYYHLALKNMRFIAMFAVSTFLEIIMLVMFHSSLIEMVEVLLAANILILVMSLVFTWRCNNDICNHSNV